MPLSASVRSWHKWISVVVGLQLLAWTTGGLVFTLDPIEEVRGEHLVSEPPIPEPVDPSSLRPLASLDTGPLAGARLTWRRGRWVWETGGVLIDARSGEALPPVDAAEAESIASRRFLPPASVMATVLVTEAAGEYRDKPVPAWRVTFDDDEATNVYVDAASGEITTVRSDTWRTFDFFWMLHIMDYDARKDFSHPLLTTAACFGVSTAVTGLWLAVVVFWPRRRAG